MKKTQMIAVILSTVVAMAGFAQERRVLVVYYSKSGNTEKVAKTIAAETGGTLARIIERDPYPANKKENMERAKDEHRRRVRPEIECPVADLSAYNVIFVGYPLWCGHAPAPILTFLESHDFDGKRVKIVPFVTYGGSPFARGTEDLRQSAPGAAFGKTIAVRAATVPKSADRVRKAARQATERAE